MTVILNGIRTAVAPGTTIARLVASSTAATSGIAVALNDEVVSRSRWETTEVGEGDRIELLGPAGGG